MGGKQLEQRRSAAELINRDAQVVTLPTALCKREGTINTIFMGIISNKEVPLQVVSKRVANGSKHGRPGHRGQGVVLGALGRTLRCSRSGRRLGRWSLVATEERRRGRVFLGHVCESESFNQLVMLYLLS